MRYLGTPEYDGDNLRCQPARKIIDNEDSISMAKFNKDAAGNMHMVRRFHYIRQGTVLNEHKFQGIYSYQELCTH